MLSHYRDLDPFSPLVGKARSDGKPKGWPKLKELVMTGNPLVKTEGEEAREYQMFVQTSRSSLTHESIRSVVLTSMPLFNRQMARRFATLTQLDQQPIDPAIAFQAKTTGTGVGGLTPGLSPSVKKDKAKSRARREPVVFPLPIAAGFFESEPTRDFVAGFFIK